MKVDNDTSNGQDVLRGFTDKHVLLNLNGLMSGLCGNPDIASRILDEDEDKFYSISSRSDWEETARNNGWVGTDNQVSKASLDGGETVLDSWEEACYEDNLDPIQTEALEFWAVTDWFGEKLLKESEMVEHIAGIKVWGRTCSGQAIFLDGVVSRIYNSTH